MADVPEVMSNVCGTIGGNCMITELADDYVKRDYGVYNAYDHDNPETITQIYIANPEVSTERWKQSMSATQCVLEAVRGRSLHFPTLVKAGKVKHLIFGAEGIQEHENDAETYRAVLIIKSPLPYVLLSNITSFSPNGVIPVELALNIGLGMIRALAALHRCGFIHRLVSPHSFSYITPPTIDKFVNRLMITDMSLCMPWPRRPRTNIPFVGTLRYSALKVHEGREQGPCTDIQSVIFVIAELVAATNSFFPRLDAFLRLPREIRSLYRDMMLTSAQTFLDYDQIQNAFKLALMRRGPKAEELPSWLFQPGEE
ncbi:Protein kinase domain-containing protein [Aphelenchoides besseyi]|nr:Protein kinase domain-containing protein [Aphelenchoides besseyi]